MIWLLAAAVAIAGVVLVSAVVVDVDGYFRTARELRRLDEELER